MKPTRPFPYLRTAAFLFFVAMIYACSGCTATFTPQGKTFVVDPELFFQSIERLSNK